jgi:hypothetical protein
MQLYLQHLFTRLKSFSYEFKYIMTFTLFITAYATQVPFVLGLVGISYAIISTSWDEEPGSILGFKEFGINKVCIYIYINI